jgi:hypothetical protein
MLTDIHALADPFLCALTNINTDHRTGRKKCLVEKMHSALRKRKISSSLVKCAHLSLLGKVNDA